MSAVTISSDDLKTNDLLKLQALMEKLGHEDMAQQLEAEVKCREYVYDLIYHPEKFRPDQLRERLSPDQVRRALQ
jgi:hypothetical protein